METTKVEKALRQYEKNLERMRQRHEAARQAKIEAGEVIRPRGRPPLDPEERERRAKERRRAAYLKKKAAAAPIQI